MASSGCCYESLQLEETGKHIKKGKSELKDKEKGSLPKQKVNQGSKTRLAAESVTEFYTQYLKISLNFIYVIPADNILLQIKNV